MVLYGFYAIHNDKKNFFVGIRKKNYAEEKEKWTA